MIDLLLCNKEEANSIAVMSKPLCDPYDEYDDFKIIGKHEDVQKLVEAGYDKVVELAKQTEFDEFLKEEHTKNQVYDYIMSKRLDSSFMSMLESKKIIERIIERTNEGYTISESIIINYDVYNDYVIAHGFNEYSIDDLFEDCLQIEEILEA